MMRQHRSESWRNLEMETAGVYYIAHSQESRAPADKTGKCVGCYVLCVMCMCMCYASFRDCAISILRQSGAPPP